MVYISKVYTKYGDEGDTMLASGDRTRKDDPRVCAYGDVDELNSVVGLVRTEIARAPDSNGAAFLAELDAQLRRIQQELFNLGADLATPGEQGNKLHVEPRHIEALERDLDAVNDALEPLRSFILPGGGPIGSALHLARTVCRRAERETVALARTSNVRPESVRYLNRLSDYFFVMARAAAQRLGHDEVLWDPTTT